MPRAVKVLPEPSDRERAAIEDASVRHKSRRARANLTVAVTKQGTLDMRPKHADLEGSGHFMCDLLGTGSADSAIVTLTRLADLAATPGEPVNATPMQAALAFVAAVDPVDELEAALAT